MKQYKGFKSEAPAPKYPMLPAGTYVCGIKALKIEGTAPDQQLILRLDIIEGDYVGYYTKRYEHDSQNAGFNQQFQAKYKGDFKLQIPNDENATRQFPQSDEKKFNSAMHAIEHSNTTLKFDWDKIWAGDFAFLKGKTVGINVYEDSYQDYPFTRIGRLEIADDVRKGIIETMKAPKRRDQPAGAPSPSVAAAAAPDPYGFTPVETDELPF